MIIKNIILAIHLFSSSMLPPSAGLLTLNSNVHFMAYCCESRDVIDYTPRCLTCVLEMRLQPLWESTRRKDLQNIRGLIKWRGIAKLLLFRCIKIWKGLPRCLMEWLLHWFFCGKSNYTFLTQTQNLLILDALWWEISINSAVQKLRVRIIQNCTGEGLFITAQQTCILLYILRKDVKSHSFFPPPFCRGMFLWNLCMNSESKKKKQESLFLRGRKFVLTLKIKKSVDQRSKQQTWENNKCSVP